MQTSKTQFQCKVLTILVTIILLYHCKTTSNRSPTPLQDNNSSQPKRQQEKPNESPVGNQKKGAEIKDAIKDYMNRQEHGAQKGIFQKKLLNEVLQMEDEALTQLIETESTDLAERSDAALKALKQQDNEKSDSNPDKSEDPNNTQAASESDNDSSKTERSSMITAAIFLGTCVISGTWGLLTVRDFYRFQYKGHAAVQIAAAIGFFVATGAWFDDTYKDDEYILFGIAAILEGTVAISVYRDLVKRKIFQVKNVLPQPKYQDISKNLPLESPALAKKSDGKTMTTQIPEIEIKNHSGAVKKANYIDYITDQGKKIWGSSKFWMAWGAYEAVTGAIYIKKALSDGFQLTKSRKDLTPEQLLLQQISKIIENPVNN